MATLSHNSLPLKKSQVTKCSVFLISGRDNEQRNCQGLHENPYVPHALPSNLEDAGRIKVTYSQHRKDIFVFSLALFGSSNGIKSISKNVFIKGSVFSDEVFWFKHAACVDNRIKTCFSVQFLKDKVPQTKTTTRARFLPAH